MLALCLLRKGRCLPKRLLHKETIAKTEKRGGHQPRNVCKLEQLVLMGFPSPRSCSSQGRLRQFQRPPSAPLLCRHSSGHDQENTSIPTLVLSARKGLRSEEIQRNAERNPNFTTHSQGQPPVLPLKDETKTRNRRKQKQKAKNKQKTSPVSQKVSVISKNTQHTGVPGQLSRLGARSLISAQVILPGAGDGASRQALRWGRNLLEMLSLLLLSSPCLHSFACSL